MINVGVSKKDSNVFEYRLAMFGYGDEKHVMQNVDLPIYSRAFVIKDEWAKKKLAIVVIEVGAISDKLKKAVVEKLKTEAYSEENIMISATHTHSAPGAHFGYLLYDLTAGGFNQSVFDKLVNAITLSIKEAEQNALEANIFYGEGEFHPSVEVAFNASMEAYNANDDVKKYSRADHHLATDKMMSLLHFKDVSGKIIGLINWFGVHTTSIGKDNYKMSSDNKGYAAMFMEKDMKIVAAFAQKPCADISPNFRWNEKRNKMTGKFDDDYASAKYNGILQYEKAKKIIEDSENTNALDGEINYYLQYVDLSNTIIDAEFSASKELIKTTPAAMGAAFARGMTDGFGLDRYSFQVLKFISFVSKSLSLFSARFKGRKKFAEIKNKYKLQGNKAVFLETTHPAIFNMKPSFFAYALSPFDKVMRYLKAYAKAGSINHPWTPHLLPIQLITIGSFAVCGIPAEISITAGKRLQEYCLSILQKIGIEHIVIAPYSNGYAGYITTPEEYEVQAYEGGHTMFGKYSFLAFQTHFKKLCLTAVEKKAVSILLI